MSASLPAQLRRARPVTTLPMSLLLFCLGMTALFSLRTIPLTTDDEFYLEYFSSVVSFAELTDNWVLFLLDEPVFRTYTTLSASLFGAETSTRLLIALTLLPHLLLACRADRVRGWAYFGGYLLFVELAPHLSWVQLRQGFAVALLALLFAAVRRGRLVGVFVIGLLHTSMLILLPCFALAKLRRRSVAYALVGALSLALLLVPDIVGQLSFLMGRREAAYLDEDPTYSLAYVLFSLLLMVYVTRLFRTSQNAGEFLTYHAMCAIVLPMFFMTTVGAFAERLYFVVRWYELRLVTQASPRASPTAIAGYIAMNLAYSAYHSAVNFGTGGGVLDRYLLMLLP